MTTYSVFITRVTEYTVDALDSDTAELACLGALTGFELPEGATIPEVIDEETVRVKSTPTFGLVVQVVFEHASGTTSSPYAYGVPDGLAVRIGDDVLVPPAGYRAQPSLAKVVDVGRGGYDGPLKALVGRVVGPDPEYIDEEFESDRTPLEDEDWDPAKDRGLGQCPDCGYFYQDEAVSSPCRGTMS